MASERRVNFRADERLLERADALAAVEHKDRTTVIHEALEAFIDSEVENEGVRRAIANAYFDDDLTDEQVRLLVGVEDARTLRAQKRQLEDDALAEDLADL